jgi:cold shock CspA family protein
MNGIVKMFDERLGYGFITPLIGKPGATAPVFFHASAVRGRMAIPAGAEVSFVLCRGDKGPQAGDVRLLPLNRNVR